MGNLDLFGQKMFTMEGFTQFAAPLAVAPAVKGPPPFGIWPVSFTPEAVAEQAAWDRARIGQAAPVAPAVVPIEKQADLFGVVLGLTGIGIGLYAGLQPGAPSVKKYLAPGASALAGLGLLVKSV